MILYFGNQLSERSTPTLYSKYFKEFGDVVVGSKYKNKIIRLLHMILILVVNAGKAKIVIIETYSTSAFYFAFCIAYLSDLFSIPFVPVLHGGETFKRIKTNPKLSDIIFRKSKINITPSKFIQAEFHKNGFKVDYIPNFIEIENYNFLERKKCGPMLLWVRAFHEIYNPLMAVKTFIEISKVHPEARLCMVGPVIDSSFKECEKLLAKCNLSNNVTFPGLMKRSEWLDISGDYDIFLNTTNIESFGLSLIEAAACGLPLITTSAGELKYLYKHRVDAMVVGKNDIKNMVLCTKEIIDDEHLANSLSKRGGEKSKKYTWDHVKPFWSHVIKSTKV